MADQYKTTLRLLPVVKQRLDFIRKNAAGNLLGINPTITVLINAEYKRMRSELLKKKSESS